MITKKILFLAHDPGGYEAINPLVEKSKQDLIPHLFFACGPSAVMHGTSKIENEEIIEQVTNGLQNDEFSVLITGTSWGSQLELEAMKLFQGSNIPTISIIDYWSNYRERFVMVNGEIHYPDFLILMDEIAYKEALEAGVPESIIRVLGHPGFDQYAATKPQSSKDRGFALHPLKVLFLSQPISELYNTSLGFTEFDVFNDCIEIFSQVPNLSLYLKFHPKDTERFRAQYQQWSIEGKLLDILPNYDLVVGMSTMGLLHASLLGIPIISYQPNLSRNDSAITNKLGLSPAFYSKQDLLEFVSNNFNIFTENYNSEAIKLMWMDGNSSARVMNFVREVLMK